MPFFDFEELARVAYLVTINLDKVIDINYYPVIQTRTSNMRHRPIGLGIQGLAETFFKLRYPFESKEAWQLNRDICETILYSAYRASNDLAKKYGPYPSFFKGKGSPASQGKLHPDLFVESMMEKMRNMSRNTSNIDISKSTSSVNENKDGSNIDLIKDKGDENKDKNNTTNNTYTSSNTYTSNTLPLPDLNNSRYDWDKLRKSIQKYGLRNSLLVALMPTQSTSQILGNTESFEPIASNIFVRRTLSGDYVSVNQYLVRDLIAAGLWNEDMKKRIIIENGSIQNIDEIPLELKQLYKTIWEIPQKILVNMSIARAPFVDQSQSLNIYMKNPTYAKLISCFFHGWRNNLKTGMYYLRTKPAADPIKFTISPDELKNARDMKNSRVEEVKDSKDSKLMCEIKDTKFTRQVNNKVTRNNFSSHSALSSHYPPSVTLPRSNLDIKDGIKGDIREGIKGDIKGDIKEMAKSTTAVSMIRNKNNNLYEEKTCNLEEGCTMCGG